MLNIEKYEPFTKLNKRFIKKYTKDIFNFELGE